MLCFCRVSGTVCGSVWVIFLLLSCLLSFNQIIDAVSAASFHSVYLYTAAEKNDIVQTIPHEDLNLFERVEKTLSKASFKTSIDNNRCCLHRFAQFMYTAEKNDIIHRQPQACVYMPTINIL